ncbi:MAG TPA: VWA domain-containing protein [Pirellulaceae bacterium]|nr:VWA domain-containing protein [Pirellulaceae bacterium]
MKSEREIGGIIHTYQKYDPVRMPGPLAEPPDLVTPLMNRLLAYGSVRHLTEEELANAIRLDPNAIARLGPSLDVLMAILAERKKKILETYETVTVQAEAKRNFTRAVRRGTKPPADLREAFRTAVHEEQIFDLEELWYVAEDKHPDFARQLVALVQYLGDKYQIDELAAHYQFTGRQSMTIPEALAIKEELEQIDKLLKQLEEAAQTAQLAVIDLEELAEFVEPHDMQALAELKRTIEDYVRESAAQQGLLNAQGKFQLTPQAYRVFQRKLLARIFSELKASRTGRHSQTVHGEGAVELPQTKPYEFGDSLTHLDIPQSLVNSMLRHGPGLPIRLSGDDLVVHRTRNSPKCATVVVLDMSGSMRYDGQYIQVKRMALALEGLIRSEYPGDYLGFVEMYTFAKVRQPGEVLQLMPKPVTLFDSLVGYQIDMSRPDISEHMIHQHFTNIQHALNLSRRLLANQDTPNKQVILITDGLPTAHFEEHKLYLMYPPQPRTEQWTMREAHACAREGITINMFLVPNWSQSEADVQFAQRVAQSTRGRVFFTGGDDLDRFVVWDYVQRKREILG